MAEPSRLERARPVLAGLTAMAALLAVGARLWGPMSSFAQGLPVVAICATWLARATGARAPQVSRLAAATLLIAPAVGFRVTRVGIDSFEAGYLLPERALSSLLHVAAYTPRGTGPLLLAAGLAAAVGLGRAAGPVVGACLGGALGAWLGRLLLATAGAALAGEDFVGAARYAQLSGWVGALALAGGLLGLVVAAQDGRAADLPPGLRRVPALMTILVALACGWVSSPPLDVLVHALPAPLDAQRVQNMPPGRSYAAPALDPRSLDDREAIDAQLAALGLHRQRPDPWPCTPLPPHDWAALDRNAVIVALPAEAPVRRLGPALRAMLDRGAYDLVLPGRAPPMPGDFGARARWSSIALTIDRPPEGVAWLSADAHGWQVVEPAPWFGGAPGVCALIVDPSMSIGQLTRLAHQLGTPGADSPCPDGLALVPPGLDEIVASQESPDGCATVPAP